MKFGLAYEMQNSSRDQHSIIEETIEQCIAADEMGWDYVWFVEHHFLADFSLSPCPELIFGALSRLTKRIRLGFGVVILPYHHPVRVAERIAMLDHLSHGRIDFGTGRSAVYEQVGMGINPQEAQDMWEESLTMIPKIWASHTFEWDGKFWKVPPRQVLPKPYQQPHPPIWLSALQPSTYERAARKGIGVKALSIAAPSLLAPHVKAYRENIKSAEPVGNAVNNQWMSMTMGFCDEDSHAARELSFESLKNFAGPDKPYFQDQKDLYETLLKQWGGVPDHLKQNFSWYTEQEKKAEETGEPVEWSGGDALAHQVWRELDSATVAERGVIVAGDPEDCIRAVKMHEAIGVDQLEFLMATETIPHDKVMKSIEMFGKYVIPGFKKAQKAATG